MPYRNYNSKEAKPTPQHLSALNPAKPIPPTAGAKPFPPPPSTSMMKEEQIQTPDSSVAMVTADITDDDAAEKTELNKTKEGKITKKQKQKWSKTDKKNYINIRLRRMISPKPPVLILEELAMQEHTDLSYSFLEPVSEGGIQFFTCEVTVHGAVFTGSGPTKRIAKNIAAEGAIHAFITNSVSFGEPNPDAEDVADNAPWKALASLGLFKLFNDWQSQGYSLPPQFLSTPNPLQKVTANPQQQFAVSDNSNLTPSSFIQKAAKMPDDPTSKHPVMLLNELHPGVPFEGSLGMVPGNIFSMTVEVQGRSFQGTGRSKKEAKKACAMAALKSLHNINYSQT